MFRDRTASQLVAIERPSAIPVAFGPRNDGQFSPEAGTEARVRERTRTSTAGVYQILETGLARSGRSPGAVYT
jgi:hypothetical protein